MNIILIFQKLYMEFFAWAFDDEFELDRTFNGLKEYHTKALPDSENKVQAIYSKLFKSKLFYLLSPIIYMFLRFQMTKFSSPEYLEKLVERSLED